MPAEPFRGKQPFILPHTGKKWTVQDEVRRLDHICGVVFEGSIALTAVALILAFTEENNAIQAFAIVLAITSVIPAITTGSLLAFNPLSATESAPQLDRLAWQMRCVQAALFLVVVVVPALGAFAIVVLFAPDAFWAAVLASFVGAVVGAAPILFLPRLLGRSK